MKEEQKIQDIKKKRNDLENKINELINTFTRDTELQVEQLQLDTYARWDMSGHLLASNANVKVVIRL